MNIKSYCQLWTWWSIVLSQRYKKQYSLYEKKSLELTYNILLNLLDYNLLGVRLQIIKYIRLFIVDGIM